MIMDYKVISFYKYITVKQPILLQETIRKMCIKYQLTGRILLGEEGINGAVSGETQNIESFKERLQEYFSDLTFREQTVKKQAFHKLTVKVRKEIVHFGKKVNINDIG